MIELSSEIKHRATELEERSPGAMVAIFGPTGHYLYASKSHSELLGFTPAELVGGKNLMRDLIPPEDQPHLQLGFMDAVLHGRSIVISVGLLSKSGKVVPVRAEAWHLTDAQSGQAYLLGRATPTEAGQSA